MNYFAWLWHNSRGTRGSMALLIAVGTARTALGLLTVWMSRWFIDSTIRTGDSSEILRMAGWLILTALGAVLLRQVGFWLTTSAGARQTNVLRLRIFRSLFHRSLFSANPLHSGDAASRLAKDIEKVCTVMTDTLPRIVVTVIQLFGAFLLMRWFDSRLAWTLLILTPVALVSGKFISRRLRRMTLAIRHEESRIQMQVQEAVENGAVLCALGSEEWVSATLDSMQQRLKVNLLRRARFTVAVRLIMGSAFTLGYFLAFVWGGLGLRNGTITFGVMTSFLQLVAMIQQPVLQLLNMVPEVIHATASIDRLETLESGERWIPNVSPSSDGAVRLTDVSFRYPGDGRPVLDHFSHTFPPGSKTAVMGSTGIGKTTLFRLLMGFVKPSGGKIEVGGKLSFMPQGNTLMSGTIRYNLLLARPDATEVELRDVLYTACAEFVYELPEGLDTELGERGAGLSEGQAQRVALARGLLYGGDVLLLDEVSASLDESTEKELYSRLFTRCPDKTVIFITHRPVVAEWCGEVVRL